MRPLHIIQQDLVHVCEGSALKTRLLLLLLASNSLNCLRNPRRCTTGQTTPSSPRVGQLASPPTKQGPRPRAAASCLPSPSCCTRRRDSVFSQHNTNPRPPTSVTHTLKNTTPRPTTICRTKLRIGCTQTAQKQRERESHRRLKRLWPPNCANRRRKRSWQHAKLDTTATKGISSLTTKNIHQRFYKQGSLDEQGPSEDLGQPITSGYRSPFRYSRRF